MMALWRRPCWLVSGCRVTDWRQSGVVVGVVRVPASRGPPRVLVLRRQPAGIWDVSGSPPWILPDITRNRKWVFININKSMNNAGVFVCVSVTRPVVALASDGPVALRQTAYVTAGSLQLRRAARHLQQVLHVAFTQQLCNITHEQHTACHL